MVNALAEADGLDESTMARVLESARLYAGALVQLEAQKLGLLKAQAEAKAALVRALGADAQRHMEAQARMAELALGFLSVLPLEERILHPVPELLGPVLKARQLELQWCQLVMEGVFLEASHAALASEDEALDGGCWVALRATIAQASGASEEAWQRSCAALPAFLEAWARVSEQVEVVRSLPPDEGVKAWLGLEIPLLAGLAYRVESPLRQAPQLHALWLSTRRAWVQALVPPQEPKLGLKARVTTATRRLTDRLQEKPLSKAGVKPRGS